MKAILTQPEIIAGELASMKQQDPTSNDLPPIERAIADVERKQRALINNLALLDPHSAELVREQLARLGAQRRALESEREAVLQRRATWETASAQLSQLATWCRSVESRLGQLNYQQKRMLLKRWTYRFGFGN